MKSEWLCKARHPTSNNAVLSDEARKQVARRETQSIAQLERPLNGQHETAEVRVGHNSRALFFRRKGQLDGRLFGQPTVRPVPLH
jgi:hypothetical protein